MVLPLLALLSCTRAPAADGAAGDSAPTPTAALDGIERVVWISIDTTRADRLTPYGYDRGTTPALEAWASTATVFDRATSHAPWTKPSMASVFTSTLPDVHGVTQWNTVLDPEQPTVALVLQEAGFATVAHVGSFALDAASNTFHLGFDTYDPSSWKDQGGNPHNVETSTVLTDQAVASFERLVEDDAPFFLWVHYYDPHFHFLPHEAHDFGSAESDVYDGEIAHSDAELGRLLAAIDAVDDVLVVFHADHGEEFGDHGGARHTRTLYDELVHVPLMLKVPGCPPGRIPANVGLMDVAPSVLQLLDVPAPDGFEGASLLGPGGCPQVDADRLVLTETRRQANLRGSFDGRYKVIRREGTGAIEVYDVQADPLEQDDLAGKDPDFDAARLEAVEARYGPFGG